MKKTLVIALFTILAADVLAAGRSRAIRDVATVAPGMDFSAPSFPLFTVPVSIFTDAAVPHGALTLTVKAETLTDAPWSDAGWLLSHGRLFDGFFAVPVYRLRVTNSRSSWCEVQTLALPAAPHSVAVAEIDLSRFTPTDYIVFESWPAYRVSLIAEGPGNRLPIYATYQQHTFEHAVRSQVGVQIGCEE